MAQLVPNSWTTIGESGFIIRLRGAGNTGLGGVRGSLEKKGREKKGLQSKTPTSNTFLTLEGVFFFLGGGCCLTVFSNFPKPTIQQALPLYPVNGQVWRGKQASSPFVCTIKCNTIDASKRDCPKVKIKTRHDANLNHYYRLTPAYAAVCLSSQLVWIHSEELYTLGMFGIQFI